MSVEESQIQDNMLTTSANLAEADIKLIGDKTIICQIVQFLAYVRHAIKNNLQKDINVSIGNNIANGQLLFDVNGLEIPDLITQDHIDLN